MNKPIAAAVTGVLFGGILSYSAYHYMSSCSYHRGCQRQARVVEVQAAPQPQLQIAQPAEPAVERPVTAEIRECDESARALSEAQTAFVNGEFQESMRLAKLCTKVSPVRAWRIIGAAACNLKDLEMIEQSYSQLDAPGRQYLVYACTRQGVIAKVKKGKTMFVVTRASGDEEP